MATIEAKHIRQLTVPCESGGMGVKSADRYEKRRLSGSSSEGKMRTHRSRASAMAAVRDRDEMAILGAY